MKNIDKSILGVQAHRDFWYNIELHNEWFSNEEGPFYEVTKALLNDPEYSTFSRMINDKECTLIYYSSEGNVNKSIDCLFLADSYNIIEVSRMLRSFDGLGLTGCIKEIPTQVRQNLSNRLKDEGGYKGVRKNDVQIFKKLSRPIQIARGKNIERKKKIKTSISLNITEDQYHLYKYALSLLGRKRIFIENMLDSYEIRFKNGILYTRNLAIPQLNSTVHFKRIQFPTNLYYYEKFKRVLRYFKNRDHFIYDLFSEFKSLAIGIGDKVPPTNNTI